MTPKQVITVYTHECIYIDAPEKEHPHIFIRSIHHDGFALTFQWRSTGAFYFDVDLVGEHTPAKLRRRYRQAIIELLVKLDLCFKRKTTKGPYDQLYGQCTESDASEIFALLEAQRHESVV